MTADGSDDRAGLAVRAGLDDDFRRSHDHIGRTHDDIGALDVDLGRRNVDRRSVDIDGRAADVDHRTGDVDRPADDAIPRCVDANDGAAASSSRPACATDGRPMGVRKPITPAALLGAIETALNGSEKAAIAA